MPGRQRGSSGSGAIGSTTHASILAHRAGPGIPQMWAIACAVAGRPQTRPAKPVNHGLVTRWQESGFSPSGFSPASGGRPDAVYWSHIDAPGTANAGLPPPMVLQH
ncbi:hypothetical protein CT19431_40575 [Cupriavidus taiwanensis]|nr:hypothetical protein CT19431_40575 [Cupriavidus taiwanensis]